MTSGRIGVSKQTASWRPERALAMAIDQILPFLQLERMVAVEAWDRIYNRNRTQTPRQYVVFSTQEEAENVAR